MRREYLERIEAERLRNLELPGSENDVLHTPNGWAARAAHYLFDEARRGSYIPTREDFENSLIKAAAVILAALENSSNMARLGHLLDDTEIEKPNDFVNVLKKISDIKE